MRLSKSPALILLKASSFLGLLLYLIASGVLVTVVHAQDVEDVVRTDISVVKLNIGVVDRRGRPITTLRQGDFAIFEDGVRQSILHFEPTESPFSLVLLLDTSGSTISFRQQLKQAAWRFLDALGPQDRVAVIQFNSRIKLLSNFSTDRRRTAYAIELAEGAGATHFYEALDFSLKALQKEGQRRKAIVVLTDGLDTQMRNVDRTAVINAETDEEAIAAVDPAASSALNAVLNAADRQGVTVYPLALPSGDPKRLPLPDPIITGIYSAARTRLQTLADRTGGRLSEINRLDQMARLYAEVAADLRTLYTVTYQARGERLRAGKWHEIRVEVSQPELIARTRPGYFSR